MIYYNSENHLNSSDSWLEHLLLRYSQNRGLQRHPAAAPRFLIARFRTLINNITYETEQTEQNLEAGKRNRTPKLRKNNKRDRTEPWSPEKRNRSPKPRKMKANRTKKNMRASPCNSSTYCSAKVLRPDLRIDIPAAGATRRAFAFGACGERGFGGGELVIVSFLERYSNLSVHGS